MPEQHSSVPDFLTENILLGKFVPEHSLGNGNPQIVPVYAGDGNGLFGIAFGTFIEKVGTFAALPLFVTSGEHANVNGLPAEFILPVFDLHLFAARAKLLQEKYPNGLPFKLIKDVFAKEFGRSLAARFIAEHPTLAAVDAKDGVDLFQQANRACGLVPHVSEKAPLPIWDTASKQWNYLSGSMRRDGRGVGSADAMEYLEAMLELKGKPGVVVFDDLVGKSDFLAYSPHQSLLERLREFEHIFEVSAPVLPVQGRHQLNPDELLPIIQAEIRKLARPLAAVVDMNWLFADSGERDPWFGLELIRLIKRARPNLPVFVWSPINDKQTLQRAMQLGSSSCFDKDTSLIFGHEQEVEADGDINDLNQGKLWFHVLEWEATRYQIPPVARVGDFLKAETEIEKKNLATFLNPFVGLTDKSKPVIQLLRALVPEASYVKILQFFGGGQSGSERPFLVQGHTASGRQLRPVQIKFNRDWRALAREGKGYRDVFSSSLGPAVAHVLDGPYRYEDWCGMSQSYAAPEEAITDSAATTQSLHDWLGDNLHDSNQCRTLVDAIFDGVLIPFYKGNLTELNKRTESVVKSFERMTPAHINAFFAPAPETKTHGDDELDLTPDKLSIKDEKARREMACRQWRKAEAWFGETDDKGIPLIIRGLVVDTLETDSDPNKSPRLRLLDKNLGVKIDLTTDKPDVAARWKALASSPIKLRGLPVSFALYRNKIKELSPDSSPCLFAGWQRAVKELLVNNGILADSTNNELWDRIGSFFHPQHPLDWSEEFHVGPTHGDLNLGNILLHKKNNSCFPWLIDFDKAEDNRPVVFDLAKLEIEAYHKIAQKLFGELFQICGITSSVEQRAFLRRFDQGLESAEVGNLDLFWLEFKSAKTIEPILKQKVNGLFAYLKQVHKRVTGQDEKALKIGRREFLLGRALYCFCCLKLRHLYDKNKNSNAPFPAQILLWKLDDLLAMLDKENGIDRELKTELLGKNTQIAHYDNLRVFQQRAISVVIDAVRKARNRCETIPLADVLKPFFEGAEFKELGKTSAYSNQSEQTKASTNIAFASSNLYSVRGWEILLRLLRVPDEQLPGKKRWFRELLWYARDHGVAKAPTELAEFTAAIVLASTEPASRIQLDPKLVDYASTGRPGNTYPAAEMFRHLALKQDVKLIKVSSRGESGGTIDILEESGITICKNQKQVEKALAERGWAVVETSRELCEVDNILMKLRKETNCMKVSDLVMASISAKKAALGIGSFNVQIVCGYDAKFSELLNGGDIEPLIKRWNEMWGSLATILNGDDQRGKATGEKRVQVSDPKHGFNSNDFLSWFQKNREMQPVVFGKSLLAAQVWRELPELHNELIKRLPGPFVQTMTQFGTVLKMVEQEATDTNLKVRCPIMSLEAIDSEDQPQFRGVRCWQSDVLENERKFSDMTVLIFRFSSDIRSIIRVPFFDSLYAEIAKDAPTASIVFGWKWLAIISPKTNIKDNLHKWCWNVLRNGFEANQPIKGDIP